MKTFLCVCPAVQMFHLKPPSEAKYQPNKAPPTHLSPPLPLQFRETLTVKTSYRNILDKLTTAGLTKTSVRGKTENEDDDTIVVRHLSNDTRSSKPVKTQEKSRHRRWRIKTLRS